MTTKVQADWLIATVTSDLGVTNVVKGAPAWDRPSTSTVAYVQWSQSQALEPTRIGQTVTRYTTRFVLTVNTANEIALWTMIDAIEAMMQSRTEATIGGTRYRIEWGVCVRSEPVTETVEALRYAAEITVSMTR